VAQARRGGGGGARPPPPGRVPLAAPPAQAARDSLSAVSVTVSPRRMVSGLAPLLS
jgi:hypothetical protein